jgi:hypothetical protein
MTWLFLLFCLSAQLLTGYLSYQNEILGLHAPVSNLCPPEAALRNHRASPSLFLGKANWEASSDIKVVPGPRLALK